MNITMVYFSATGNTRVISEEIALRLQDGGTNTIRLIPLEGIIDEENWENCDILLIGYPVYDFLPPDNVLEFLKALPPVEQPKPLFVYSTYSMGPLDADAHSAAILSGKGYVLMGAASFKAPAPSIFLFANPENPFIKGNARFGKDILDRLDRFAHGIQKSAAPIQGNREPEQLKFHPLNRIMQRFSRLTYGNIFYRNLKANDKCRRCGLCVSACPRGILEIKEGRLTAGGMENCLRCLRCHQVCPYRAIQFTSARRRGEYKSDKSRELFERL